MPHDHSMTGPHGDSSVRLRDQKPEPGPDCANPAWPQSESRTKKRALIFAGTLLLIVFMLVAMFERGLDSGIATRQLLGKLRSTGSGITLSQAPAVLLLGIGAGLFAGMLGMGGGVLKVAGMLLLLKLDILFARAVSLTTMFIGTSCAIWLYTKRGFPIWQSIRPMLLPAAVGLVGGALLGNYLRSSTLACLFGFFVLFLGFYTLAMVFDDPKQNRFTKDRPDNNFPV